MATETKEFKTVRICGKQHSRIKQQAARFGITLDDALKIVIQRGLSATKGDK